MIVRADQADQVRGVTAAGVQDRGTRPQIPAGDLVQRVAAARFEAAVKGLVHLPRLGRGARPAVARRLLEAAAT